MNYTKDELEIVEAIENKQIKKIAQKTIDNKASGKKPLKK